MPGLLTLLAFPMLAAGVALLSVWLRAQYLTDIPRYTDEINEITPAFDIVRGTSLPLVSGPKHLGSFFDFVLAGTMLVFGRSPDLPRVVVLVASLVTVFLTYGYARTLGGRWAGLIAAGLLAVSAPHILLSSRVAWSASLTPLLGMGAAWTLDLAVSRRRPWLLLAAGLCAGLALQAHPSFMALLPGFGVYALLRARPCLRTPQPYLAGLLFLAACANVVIYNWQSSGGGARSVTQEYPGEGLGAGVYLENVGAPLHGLVLTLASTVDPTTAPAVADWFPLLVTGLSLVALLALARSTTALPLLATLSAVLLLPFVHDDFTPLLKARYIMPLVPLVYVAVAVLLARLVASRGYLPRLVGLGVTLVMVGRMLTSLTQFQTEMIANDCTNVPQRAFVAELNRRIHPGEWILLDEGVLPSAERLGYLTLLELSSKRVGETRLERQGVWKELRERPSFLTAVSDGKAKQVFEKQGMPLLPQTVTPTHPASRTPDANGSVPMQGIGLYRVTSEGATLLTHDAEPGCADLRTN
jgi:4-amino-4-deoxy-L-arabinose transferase-like glycosyltransferase